MADSSVEALPPTPPTWRHFVITLPVDAEFAASVDLSVLPQMIVGEGVELHLSRGVVRDESLYPDSQLWRVEAHYEFLWPAGRLLPDAQRLTLLIEDAVFRAIFGLRGSSFQAGAEALGRHRQEVSEQASARASALLSSRLSRRQRADLSRHGSFLVKGSAGGRYRLSRERQINITEVGTGVRWCYVNPEIPLEDQLLAQLLLITADEPYFRQVAAQWSPA